MQEASTGYSGAAKAASGREESAPKQASPEPPVWTGGILGVDGGPRIDTRPEEPSDIDDRTLSPNGWDESDLMSEYSAESESEIEAVYPAQRQLEPDEDQLETLLSEDADWRALVEAKDMTTGEIVDDAPEKTLQRQDVQDLEDETVLETRRRLGLESDPEDQNIEDYIKD